MKEKKAIFIIDILKNITKVYFDTFFVFYFFKVANYETIPLAKYYLTFYFFCGIGFILIRNAIKKGFKVSYFRIGIALQAVYISLIMLLKENIINYVFSVAFIHGIAEGFYHYPKNILNTEKVQNTERKKCDGLVNVINQITSVIIPLILGIALTFFSYTDVSKVFFVSFIIMFFLTFKLSNDECTDDKIDMKEFTKYVKKNKKIKTVLWTRILAGFTYSNGVMGLIITLSKINSFKTNLNLGLVDSICAGLSLTISLWFMIHLKEKKFKSFLILSGIVSFLTMILFSSYPSYLTLVIYLLIRCTMIILIEKIINVITFNLSNSKEMKKEYKAEFYLIRDVFFAIARCIGYTLLFVICAIVGVKYINYLMILCAASILGETIAIAKVCEN